MVNPNKRKKVPLRIRIEVFKRDKFTCQYCGAKAPDVLLQIDHVVPISKGGDNDIMNLVTSCEACNSGKSDKTLDDDSALNVKRAQLEILQERRHQIELMLDWQRGLKNYLKKKLNVCLNIGSN